MIVDKGDPQTLVSFCGDGVKKIGPTTFEMTAKNYTPQRDIDVLFIETLLELLNRRPPHSHSSLRPFAFAAAATNL